MDRSLVLRATAVAATAGLAGVIGEAASMLLAGTTLQPTVPPVPAATFLLPLQTMPQRMLLFYAADSLFVVSYLLVYAGLHAVTAPRAPALAGLALGAGIFGGLCDATENAFMISYAAIASAGAPLPEPALPLIFVIAHLKWMGALAAFAAFGLVFPREDTLGRVISVIMLLPVPIGALSVAWPALNALLGLSLLVGMALFAWYFWRAAGRAERAPEALARPAS
jgi:hypothetical protein